MNRLIVKLWRLVAPALLVSLISTACAVEKAPVYREDGVEYGVVDGLFRSRWWNYYERGCSYAEGGYWEDAEADFKKALKQETKIEGEQGHTGC